MKTDLDPAIERPAKPAASVPPTIWQRLGQIVSGFVQSSKRSLDGFVQLATGGVRDPKERRAVAFTAAMIALSAKMAKADGIVTADEIDAVQDLFHVPEGEEANVRRLFNLARRDVAGFDAYAERIRALYPGDQELLRSIVDALFHIAVADGVIHELEMSYLKTVAEVFQLEAEVFDALVARYTLGEGSDPFKILDIEPTADAQEIKRRYRQLVAEYHPDRVIARGLPEELVTIANNRLASINGAYARIRKQRGF